MSLAWEVTQDDVALVLVRHKKVKSYDDDLVDECHDELDFDLIEAAVLACTDFDDQCDAAYVEIEAQLINKGFIAPPALFRKQESP